MLFRQGGLENEKAALARMVEQRLCDDLHTHNADIKLLLLYEVNQGCYKIF